MKLASHLVYNVLPASTVPIPAKLAMRTQFGPVFVDEDDSDNSDEQMVGVRFNVVIDDVFFCELVPYECRVEPNLQVRRWKCIVDVIEIVGQNDSAFGVEKTLALKAKHGGFIHHPYVPLSSPDLQYTYDGKNI